MGGWGGGMDEQGLKTDISSSCLNICVAFRHGGGLLMWRVKFTTVGAA